MIMDYNADDETKAVHRDVLTQWGISKSRLVGHVILSPPISVGYGSEGYTEDWAVIEMDASKIDGSNFQGNSIDLGTVLPYDFTCMMYPHNDHTFEYPHDRLLRLNSGRGYAKPHGTGQEW